MPTFPHQPAPPFPGELPRRAALRALVAAGVLAVTACDGSPSAPPTGSDGPGPTTTPAGPDPLLADIADTGQLLSVYDRVLSAYPTLATRLRPLRANHAAHLAALQTAAGVTATATPTTGTAATPKTPAAALAQLRAAEGAAVAARTRSAVRSSGGRAALLASIAAACATHQAVLT